MGGYIVKSGNYDFGELGIIHVNIRSTAKSVRARWKGGSIVVSAPLNIPYDRLKATLEEFAPRLEAMRPDPVYSIGRTLQLGEVTVVIGTQTRDSNRIFAHFTDHCSLHIEVGGNWDMEAADTIRVINKFIRRAAQTIAPGILIPRARALAAEVGDSPMAWEISNGARILGHCSSKRVIALSSLLVLYPEHLRDYVMYHELAHLSEMNHSARFHSICNAYCRGREKQWIKELKAYHMPVGR